jgi:hypothetical protein
LVKQVRFASKNGLNGVVWQTNADWIADSLEKIIGDYGFGDRYRRLSVRVELHP